MNIHGNANSHIDALRHVLLDGTRYNGVPGDTVTAAGAAELSIDLVGDGPRSRSAVAASRRRPGTGRVTRSQAAYLQDLHAAGFEPGEEALQGSLIPERTMHDGLHRLHRRVELVEVGQRLGREEADDPDLVVGR